ncbi:MAG: carboxypeptidase-like regulatory domain-containing protein [Terracidiphilus sp.]
MTVFGINVGLLSPDASLSGPRKNFKLLATVVLGLFAVLFVSGTVASAQLETGQISGTVLDQTGAAVPGASIAIKNLGTNSVRNTVSSPTGAYQASGLEPAIYQVTVTAASFKPYNATVEVTVGGQATVDAKLSVSAAVTEVQVVGEGGAQVNTQTQELSQIVDSQQLASLPSLTRNPYDFVSISGNVSSGDNTTNSANSGQNLTNRGVGYAINGQRESGTEILLDGAENVSIFSVAVGEDTPWTRCRNTAF